MQADPSLCCCNEPLTIQVSNTPNVPWVGTTSGRTYTPTPTGTQLPPGIPIKIQGVLRVLCNTHGPLYMDVHCGQGPWSSSVVAKLEQDCICRDC